MRTGRFIIAAVVLATLLTACVLETRRLNGGQITVRIAIKQEGAVSRAQGAPVSDKSLVQFNGGLLLFADNSYKITKRVEIEDNDGAYDGNKVGRGALENGASITGVPSSSTKVYFVGNPSAAVTSAAVLGVDIQTLVTTVGEQCSPGTGGVERVTMFGGATLKPEDTTGQNVTYTASFGIKPIVTRIEIGGIAYSGGLTGSPTGIFINNYHPRMRVDGYEASAATNNGSTPENYISGGGSYTTGGEGTVYDYKSTGLARIDQNVWTYNLLAPRPGTSGSEMPSIVIRLDNVSVGGTALDGPQFVTLSTFKKGDTPIKELEQGKIWSIAKIVIDANDISPAPYVKSKTVAVTSTIMSWEKIPVTVGY